MSWRDVVDGFELRGGTEFVRALIPGSNGRTAGGTAPTLGLIGRLGGLGARPERIGFVSDGDGALTVLASAAKLGRMRARGDLLPGDVLIATHVCPDAPVRPHDPVPFMDSPVGMAAMNAHEVDETMDAVLSVDTTRGNRVCNHLGFAITPTVRQGWILRVSEPVLYRSGQGIWRRRLPVVRRPGVRPTRRALRADAPTAGRRRADVASGCVEVGLAGQ